MAYYPGFYWAKADMTLKNGFHADFQCAQLFIQRNSPYCVALNAGAADESGISVSSKPVIKVNERRPLRLLPVPSGVAGLCADAATSASLKAAISSS